LQLPARSRATLLVGVQAPRGGTYQLTATAQSGTAQDSASADLVVIYITEPPALYLPQILMGSFGQAKPVLNTPLHLWL